jgi:hypothetical protein
MLSAMDDSDSDASESTSTSSALMSLIGA